MGRFCLWALRNYVIMNICVREFSVLLGICVYSSACRCPVLPEPFVEKTVPSSMELHQRPYGKAIGPECVGLSADSRFRALVSASPWAWAASPRPLWPCGRFWHWEACLHVFSFFHIVLAILGSLYLHTGFRVLLKSLQKKRERQLYGHCAESADQFEGAQPPQQSESEASNPWTQDDFGCL